MRETYEQMMQDDVDHQCSIAYQHGVEDGLKRGWSTEGHPDTAALPDKGIYWRESKRVPVMCYSNIGDDNIYMGFGRYRVFETHEEWHIEGCNGNGWMVIAWFDLPEFES